MYWGLFESRRLLRDDLVSAKSIISAKAASKNEVGDGVGWGVGFEVGFGVGVRVGFAVVGFGVGCGVVGAAVVGRSVGFLVGETVGLGVEQHSPRTLQELDGIVSGSSSVS